MREKTRKLIGIAFLFAVLFLVSAALLCTGARGAEARASEAGKLVLPSAYEEYLDLGSPADFAVSEGHIVIADANKLYVYDRAEEKYTVYLHRGLDGNDCDIADVGIAEGERERVFFSDRRSYLYEYAFDPGAAAQDMLIHDISCSAFLVDSAAGALYTASAANNMVSFHRYKLEEEITPTSGVGSDSVESGVIPRLAARDGKLYAVIDTNTLASYTAERNKLVADPFVTELNGDRKLEKNPGLQSVAETGGLLYYTVNTPENTVYSGVWATDFTGNAVQLASGNGYSALAASNGRLFVVRGSSVLEIDLGKTTEGNLAFTGYEIASSSASAGRLSGAENTVRAGDLLVTADNGNSRLTVFNLKTETYTVLLPPADAGAFLPSHVATDGSLIAVSSGENIYTCVYGESEVLTRVLTAQGRINGLACVYGSVYYVTSNAMYGKLGEPAIIQDYGVPAGLTSDLYGDLFVAYETTGRVYKFAERDFLVKGAGVLLDTVLPAGYTAFRADFEGNLYALVGSTLYRADGTPLLTVHGEDYVYTNADMGALPRSFALGFEDDSVYFLFGDYIAAERADIPTLSEISAEGIKEEVFRPHEAKDLLIDIPQGTIGVRTDLALLKEDPAYFPYSFYYRTAEDLEGVLLAQKGDYVLVELYEISENDRVFTASLFHLDPEGRLLPQEDYWKEAPSAQYLSSAVSSYFFPCLDGALAQEKLPRGTSVQVRGVLSAHGREYAYVTYRTEGGTESGYVPASYLTPVDPLRSDANGYFFGKLKDPGAIVFTAEDGSQTVPPEGETLCFTDNGDGTFTARYQKDGTLYYASVNGGDIARGESDALRISLIVVLTVLAVIIVGVYVYLVPMKYRKQKG